MASGLQFFVGRHGKEERLLTATPTRIPRLRTLTASSSSTSSSSLPLSLASSKLSCTSSSWLSSSNRVRCKFFHKIGITEPIIAMPRNRMASVAERSARDLRDVPRFNVPLHYATDTDEERVERQQIQKQKQRRSSKAKKRVDFNQSVTVVPIPMRSEYSDRIKTKLWWGKSELCETVDRNLAEFAAEDYDWRNACPEEEMYYCTETKELVHPVHIELGRYAFGTGGRVNKTYINGQYCC